MDDRVADAFKRNGATEVSTPVAPYASGRPVESRSVPVGRVRPDYFLS